MQALIPTKRTFTKIPFYTPPHMMGRPPKHEAPPFGKQLAKLRKERGYSQQELADLLKISRNNLAYYERSAKNPTMDFITRCTNVLGVSVSDLLEPENRERKKTGPKPILERQFDILRQMPKRDQEFVSKMIEHYIVGKSS